jgi:hypothetical protein
MRERLLVLENQLQQTDNHGKADQEDDEGCDAEAFDHV